VPEQNKSPSATLGQLEVNQLVRVSVAGSAARGDGGEAAEDVRTRVEDVIERCDEHGRRYVIAAPRYSGDVELPAPGTPCTLEWPGVHGIWILPVTFIDEQVIREGLRAWTVEVIAPPRQAERRAFVRVEWALALTLAPLTAAEIRQVLPGRDGRATLVAEGEPVVLRGRSVNISEGGIRCLVPSPAPTPGVGVMVTIEISGESFRLPARVQWVKPTGCHGAAEIDLAVAFDDPGRHGDRLRQLLFAEQLRLRRAGLD
jgi:hypothetical protein